MERQTITQQEISSATGMSQSNVSEALIGVKPVTRSRTNMQYNPTEALEAVIAFCERKRQIVLDAAARKTAKWDNLIEATKQMLEV